MVCLRRIRWVKPAFCLVSTPGWGTLVKPVKIKPYYTIILLGYAWEACIIEIVINPFRYRSFPCKQRISNDCLLSNSKPIFLTGRD